MLVLGFLYAIALCACPSSAFWLDLFNEDDDPPSAINRDQSDGTNIQVRQPLLQATDWFLTEQEMTDSRRGIPRHDLSVYTTGNAVTPLTVPKEYFDAVYDDLVGTQEGDRVMLSSYATALIPLKPESDPSGATTRLDKVLDHVVKRGSNVNILNWSNYKYGGFNLKARNKINAIPVSPINGAEAVLVFDNRLPHLLSAYHQKTLVIVADNSSDSGDQPVAYVGGLDIVVNRWDTVYHNNSAIRDASHISYFCKGWIDGNVRIHGPAAKDVANNFVARWNSNSLHDLTQDSIAFTNLPHKNIPSPTYASSNTSGSLGTQSVQITRTFSCKCSGYKEFAPRGENSIFYARIKAIKNAKNFIYIEDQYFIHVPELLNAILEVMPKIQRLVVVTNPQTNPFRDGGYIKYLYDMVSPIREKYPNKFQIYAVKKGLGLILHTKVVIIDDVYLSVGSANWNRRSMTSDPELNAEIVDEDTVVSPEGVTVGKLPRDFRIRKFVEMTHQSYDELDSMTFMEAANQLAIAATRKSTIVEPLKIEHHAYFVAITDRVRKISDPQDVCFF